MTLKATEHPGLVAVSTAPKSYEDGAAVSASVRSALDRLNLPADFIHAGETIVLKPNWIKEYDERKPRPGQWEHVVTHPTVIEAVTRWAAAQLGTSGSIIICDAPQTDSSLARIREYCRLDEMLARCRADFPGVHVDILDLRPEEWHAVDGVTVSKTKLAGDPLGQRR